MKIELDRTKIDLNDIDGNGKPDAKPLDEFYDGKGYERDPEIILKESRKERKLKIIKKKVEEVNLNIHDGLRLIERFFNKYLGSLVGNNPNPIPSLAWLNPTRLNIFYLIIIVLLIIVLWIK